MKTAALLHGRVTQDRILETEKREQIGFFTDKLSFSLTLFSG